MITYRSITYLLTVCLMSLISAPVFGFEISHVDGPYVSVDGIDLATTPPTGPVPLEMITDTLSDNIAGHLSSHQVGFQIPGTSSETGVLRGRFAVITFPPEFDVSTVDSVSYRDTDYDSPDPVIKRVYIYSHSVLVRFNRKFHGPTESYFAYLTLHSVTNSTLADDFRVVVKIDNSDGRTLAGPDHSEYFSIYPDEASGMAIFPLGDQYLQAGEGLQFTSAIVDQYNNPIESTEAEWNLHPDYDTIGEIYGSFLQATTVGTGRVVAQSGSLTAVSDMIFVTPGDLSRLHIDHENDSITAGESLTNDVIIEAVDLYGNRVVDYAGSVWFSSNDPKEEIEDDETNPYQFASEDQGRRVFSGIRFLFKTAGQVVLSVTDGTLESSISNIYVASASMASMSVGWSEPAMAGEPIEIEISSAVDIFGNSFNGTIAVIAEDSAPDGTLPTTPDINILDGSGAGEIILVAAGDNSLRFVSGSYGLPVTIYVMPGELANLGISIDETQFMNHNFLGEAFAFVYDRYQNLKTDFELSGIDLVISSDTGSVFSDILPSDLFVDGVADLSGYMYRGDPGPVTITVSTIHINLDLSASTDIYANGIYAELKSYGMVPDWIPETWEFRARAHAWNPANLAPSAIAYKFGFADSLIEDPRPFGCIPAPFNASSCGFSIIQSADIEPGVYQYRIIMIAEYEYGDDTIVTEWSLIRQVEVLPYIEFTLEPGDLPEIGFPVEYRVNASLTLHNENNFAGSANIQFHLMIKTHGYITTLSNIYDNYDWPPEANFDLNLQFREAIPIGRYDYLVGIYMNLPMGDGHFSAVFVHEYILDRSIDIVERAQYSVDAQTLTPNIVGAGASVPFTFDLELAGMSTVELNGEDSRLIISDGSISTEARLAEDYTLNPGANTITSKAISIPANWEKSQLTARLLLSGIEADLLEVDTEIEFDFPITVVSMAGIRIVSFEVEAPNIPFVNTGQSIAFSTKIANLSGEEVIGPVVARILSDGQSLGFEGRLIEISNIAPYDTVTIVTEFTTSAIPNPAEQFVISIEESPDAEILPAIDNRALIIIQRPIGYYLNLEPEIVNIYGSSPVLDFDERFNIVVPFSHFEQLQAEGGRLVLDYTGSEDFRIQFPAWRPLDSQVRWLLTAPAMELSSSFSLRWQEIPIDLNTGQPADIEARPVEVPFNIRQSVTELYLQAVPVPEIRPLQRGVLSKLFDLSVQNSTNDYRNLVQLKTIRIGFTGRDGNLIDAQTIVSADRSGFYFAGQRISLLSFSNGYMKLAFNQLKIDPDTRIDLEMKLAPVESAGIDYFNIVLTGDGVECLIIDGPRLGQRVPVLGLPGNTFDMNLRQAIIADDLAGSFKNYPNPFNPTREATEIRYSLATDSDVNIRIFTLTGEAVWDTHNASGSAGGSEGINIIDWDGRNANGDMVINGVYVAFIQVASSGEMAKLKIAVIK